VRINVQNDWLVNDSLLCSSYFVGKHVDVVSDLSWEIEKLLSWNFFENTPRLRIFVWEMV